MKNRREFFWPGEGTVTNPILLALMELVLHVGQTAEGMGEEWRLAHPKLMKAYKAARDIVDNTLTTGDGLEDFMISQAVKKDEDIDRYRGERNEALMVIKDFIEWGAKTGSDRELFDDKFKKLLRKAGVQFTEPKY